jgi:AcrR family transcriptional regulator
MGKRSLRLSATEGSALSRDRILRVASKLFSDHGFERTTMRAITAAAQCNLASVNYHFGSKQALIEAVIEQAIRPIVKARLLALESALAGQECAPDIADLTHALVEPLYELSLGEHRGAIMLLMRLRRDANKSYNAQVSRHYKPLHSRFIEALATALPHLERSEVALRYDCARGAVLQTLVELAPARSLVLSKAEQIRGHAKIKDALKRFIRAGFEAGKAL